MMTSKSCCMVLVILLVIVYVIVKACLCLHLDVSLIVQIVLAFAAFGALIVSIKTLNEQKKSGELQRFESTFFNMMSLQEQITSQLMVEAKGTIANPYSNSALSPMFIDDSKLYEKVLEEYNDYKLALKASEETGTGA